MPILEQFIVKQDSEATITIEVLGDWVTDLLETGDTDELIFDGHVRRVHVNAPAGRFDYSVENGRTRAQRLAIVGERNEDQWRRLQGRGIPFNEFRFDVTRVR